MDRPRVVEHPGPEVAELLERLRLGEVAWVGLGPDQEDMADPAMPVSAGGYGRERDTEGGLDLNEAADQGRVRHVLDRELVAGEELREDIAGGGKAAVDDQEGVDEARVLQLRVSRWSLGGHGKC